jgi:glycosyltransferase involved in cell wall biosynthesis
MPKILRIINRLNLGGPTYNVAYLTKFLAPEFETLLVSGMKDKTEESSDHILKSLGIHPIYIPDMYRELHPIHDVKSYQSLKCIIKSFKPDIVHTHAAKAGAIGRLAAIHCDVPIIVHTFHGHVFHSYFNRLKTETFLHIERYLASRSTKIIALSEGQKRELCDLYKIAPSKKVEVIPLGFDLTRFHTNQEDKRKIFRQKYRVDDDEIAIGIIGRLVAIKNHTLFLKSIKLVSERTTKRIRCFIIGDGDQRNKMEVLASSMNLNFPENNLLTFTGWIKEVDFCNAGLDIIALTSDNEGTPVSLIEAQAAGKSIVTTDVGGIRDILIENEKALLVPRGDVEGFTKQLLTLINHDNLKKRPSKGSKVLNESFSYQKLCYNAANLYRRLLFDSQRR